MTFLALKAWPFFGIYVKFLGVVVVLTIIVRCIETPPFCAGSTLLFSLGFSPDRLCVDLQVSDAWGASAWTRRWLNAPLQVGLPMIRWEGQSGHGFFTVSLGFSTLICSFGSLQQWPKRWIRSPEVSPFASVYTPLSWLGITPAVCCFRYTFHVWSLEFHGYCQWIHDVPWRKMTFGLVLACPFSGISKTWQRTAYKPMGALHDVPETPTKHAVDGQNPLSKLWVCPPTVFLDSGFLH